MRRQPDVSAWSQVTGGSLSATKCPAPIVVSLRRGPTENAEERMDTSFPDDIQFQNHIYRLTPPFPSLPGPELLSRTWSTPTIWRDDSTGGECELTLEHWVGADGRLHSDLGGVPPTATNSRGHRAVWKLDNGLLLLSCVQGRFRLAVEGPVFADWYTGDVSFTLHTERTLLPGSGKAITTSGMRVAIESGREVWRQKTETRQFEYEIEEFQRSN